MNECLLVAVGHSEAAIPLPANSGRSAFQKADPPDVAYES
jgi:hypothetical protein